MSLRYEAVREDVAMDDLVQWLGEQLDEDTVRARETASEFGAEWTAHPRTDSVSSNTGADVLDEPCAPIDFIAAHDPARALREIDAKRAVVKALAEVVENYGRDDVEYADGWVSALGLAVRHLATAFSDRPGFRTEWRP